MSYRTLTGDVVVSGHYSVLRAWGLSEIHVSVRLPEADISATLHRRCSAPRIAPISHPTYPLGAPVIVDVRGTSATIPWGVGLRPDRVRTLSPPRDLSCCILYISFTMYIAWDRGRSAHQLSG